MHTHVHRVGFAPLIPTFIADMGLSYAAAGTIMAAYFWAYAVMQVPVGVLTDRQGARRVMLWCMGVMAVGAVAFALSHTYGQSLLARCLLGTGAAATWLPGLRLIQEWFAPRERGLATGLFSAGGGIGATTALLLLPILADRLGWRVGYALLAVPVLLTLASSGPSPPIGPRARSRRLPGSSWPGCARC
jgi:MFS family permease